MSLESRIDRLESARNCGPVVLAWCDAAHTDDEAVAAHLHRYPGDAEATLVLIGWAKPGAVEDWALPLPKADDVSAPQEPATRVTAPATRLPMSQPTSDRAQPGLVAAGVRAEDSPSTGAGEQ